MIQNLKVKYLNQECDIPLKKGNFQFWQSKKGIQVMSEEK